MYHSRPLSVLIYLSLRLNETMGDPFGSHDASDLGPRVRHPSFDVSQVPNGLAVLRQVDIRLYHY